MRPLVLSILMIGPVSTGCDPLCENCREARCGTLGTCDDGDGLLYPLVEGAWWRHAVVDPQGNARQCPDKVVRIGAEGPIEAIGMPGYILRPGVIAFPAMSLSPTKSGYRWQELDRATGSVRRHVDEWYDPRTGAGTSIEHFCPYKLRVLDGPLGRCQNGCVDERYATATLEVEGADWRDCWRVVVDPATCRPTTPVPAGCRFQRFDTSRRTTIEVTAASDLETCLDGPVVKAAMTSVGGPADEPPTTTFWWKRGLGKVREVTTPTEVEELVDACVPPACTRPAPTVPELAAQCDDPGISYCGAP